MSRRLMAVPGTIPTSGDDRCSERLELLLWLKAGLALQLLVLNLWVLRQLLLPPAPFPALIVTAALIAFLLDIPSRWLRHLEPRLIEQLDDLIVALPR